MANPNIRVYRLGMHGAREQICLFAMPTIPRINEQLEIDGRYYTVRNVIWALGTPGSFTPVEVELEVDASTA